MNTVGLVIFSISLIVFMIYFFTPINLEGLLGLFGFIFMILGACCIIYLIFAGIHHVFGPLIFGG